MVLTFTNLVSRHFSISATKQLSLFFSLFFLTVVYFTVTHCILDGLDLLLSVVSFVISEVM